LNQVSMMMKLPCKQPLLHLSNHSHNQVSQEQEQEAASSNSPLAEETMTTKSPTTTRACFEDKNS
jgi:hypothetical protein